MMSNVTVFTATYVDPDANANKFYRTYAVGRWAVFQWGRIGAAGQFKVTDRANHVTAKNVARNQVQTKLDKGYAWQANDTFDFNESIFDDAHPHPGKLASACAKLAAAYRHDAYTIPTPTPAPEPTEPEGAPDRMAALAQRALAAITLAVTDSQQAVIDYAVIRAELAEMQSEVRHVESYLSTLESLIGTA
jgi:predicted DNA-binding WGR domain protein